MKKALMAALLIATTVTLVGCGFKGFKPVKDEIANWRLKEEFNTFDLSTNEGFLQRIQKQLDDFRECGIDPVSGNRLKSSIDETEAYLCIERKGWYKNSGPICTQAYFFDDAPCVEWRKERGLEHMPKPEWK